MTSFSNDVAPRLVPALLQSIDRQIRMEKCLRKQGLKGNSYRILFGDLKDMARLLKEAQSEPMTGFSHDIAPRLAPAPFQSIAKYGKNTFLWFGSTPSVVVLEPEHIREILSKNYIYQKPPRSPLSQRMARGTGWLEGDKWAKHRKLVVPAFYVEKLKYMVSSFHFCCSNLLSKWDEIIPNEGAFELDVWPYLKAFTSDVISHTAFGSNYEEGRAIFEVQEEKFGLLFKVHNSVYIPGSIFLPTQQNRRLHELERIIESTVMSIIDKRMKLLKAGGSCGDDFLGLLLESNIKEIEIGGNKCGLSMEEIIDECKDFYLAGNETTSILLVWTMILLGKHTDWQSRAREEVLQLFGKRTPDYQELSHLKIVTMILHETLRLYPPVINLTRMTTEECKLGDLSLPAGVRLQMPIILLHHDKKIWGDDAMEFNPSRFSKGVSHATQGRLVYLPFGSGPRICLGQNFSTVEAKLAITMILQRYSFSLSPSYTHAPMSAFVLQPQHGAHIMLEKIKA
ncbi:cytochrome P450 CYP72A219-like isoform X2 [Andrographis paniculata]|uniref:cytochrome P450 CYP72A219-like isoform X2 n=1 Tax=Andrographis paniculata TaxID=175694 RepID=UPI0021E6EFB1|nr:cytochrome P450 CYP72A219-like isoform X2 [Andrographis paniculata]